MSDGVAKAIGYQPHEQRVIDERSELLSRLDKLDDFIDDGEGALFLTLTGDEQRRLYLQQSIMAAYVTVLSMRINAFPASKSA